MKIEEDTYNLTPLDYEVTPLDQFCESCISFYTSCVCRKCYIEVRIFSKIPICDRDNITGECPLFAKSRCHLFINAIGEIPEYAKRNTIKRIKLRRRNETSI